MASYVEWPVTELGYEVKGREAEELLNLVTNPTNRDILRVLSVQKESYPAEIARSLGKADSAVVRRLRALENAGLVESRWASANGRPVKMYRLCKTLLHLHVSEPELRIEKEDARVHELVRNVYRRHAKNIVTPSDLEEALRGESIPELSKELDMDPELVDSLVEYAVYNLERVYSELLKTQLELMQCPSCGGLFNRDAGKRCETCRFLVCQRCIIDGTRKPVCTACAPK